MSNMVEKFDEFRSSTSIFFLGFSSGIYLIYLSLKQLFLVGIFNSEFYFYLVFLTGGFFSAFNFGIVVLRRINKKEFLLSSSTNLLKISDFLFSPKTQTEIFQPIFSDWQEEYFEAVFKKEIWKARWINVRYTYAFLIAMWQKSPIGDLIEFVRKFAK